ncbi:MAG: PqqD family protein [Nitrososphaerales archaeon]
MSDVDECFRAGQVTPRFVAQRREDVFSVEIDGDIVIYDPVQEKSHVLNSTGGLIWQLLDGESPLEQLAEDIAGAFGVSMETVLADMVTLVEDSSN